MNEKDVYQFTFNELAKNVKVDYVDGDVAFTDSIGCDLPDPGLFRIDAIQLVACMKGTLRVDINTREYTLQPNDILCCAPNVLIRHIVGSEDLECKIITLSTRIVRQVINPSSDMRNKIFYINRNPVLHVGEEGICVFRQYCELLFSRMKETGNVYRKELVASLVSAIVFELLGCLDEYSPTTDNMLIRQGDLLFKRFIELLTNMKVKDRSVAFYADKLFVTSKYLSKVCKQVSGKTAFEFINELVMEDITGLFKYSEKSIKEIADYLDFPSISFFGKFIKAHTGLSPTEYRKQLNQR